MARKDKETKNSKDSRSQKKAEKQTPAQKTNYLPYIVILVALAVVVYLIYFVGTNYVTTQFPTFKASFLAAPRVAVSIGYSNTTQLGLMNPCFTNIIQFIAHTRNASTIDFFIINQANSTCLYSPTGLGHTISNISTQASSRCLAVANSEASVFLNYSAVNNTLVTLNHLYVKGNAQYMQACPIAPDLG